MKIFPFLLIFAALLVSACGSLPGLQALSEDTTQFAVDPDPIVTGELVMADKTGSTDPSLIAAADRIEAAVRGVDVIEIRQDYDESVLSVFMLFQPNPEILQDQVANLTFLRNVVEASWLSTLPEARTLDSIRVSLMVAQPITTLNAGPSYLGGVVNTFEIERESAIAYFNNRPNDLQDFIGLIVEGDVSTEQAETAQFYTGQPNHPMFLLPQQTEADS